MRLKNKTKSKRKATIPTQEEKATTIILWLLWKLYSVLPVNRPGGKKSDKRRGILWKGGVVRVNVATLNHVAFGISRSITKRLDLTSGSRLGVPQFRCASRETRKHCILKEVNRPGVIWCIESWDQFEKYGSPSLRHVKQVSGKTKDHRFVKYKSNLPHQRSPYAVKFEDRSHEETERQHRCARGKACNLAENIYKLKEKDQSTFYSPSEKWVMPVTPTKEPEEREFVADSGAGMHMVSERDLYSAELETMRISRSPTTVMTANGKVQTREEATVFIKELDLFLTVMLLEEPLPILSRETLRGSWVYLPLDQRSKTTTHQKKGRKIKCNKSNYIPFVVPGLSTSSSSTTPPPTSPHLHHRIPCLMSTVT